MKFKILPGNNLFDLMQDINKGLIAARATITDTLKSKGFTGAYASSSGHSYLVSCDAIEIKTGKPDGWKMMGESYYSLYYPKVSNKKDSKWVNELPRIKIDALNEPLNFSFCTGPNLEIYHRPGVAWHNEYVLIDTDNAPYEPVPGMIEILDSEYQKLYKTIGE